MNEMWDTICSKRFSCLTSSSNKTMTTIPWRPYYTCADLATIVGTFCARSMRFFLSCSSVGVAQFGPPIFFFLVNLYTYTRCTWLSIGPLYIRLLFCNTPNSFVYVRFGHNLCPAHMTGPSFHSTVFAIYCITLSNGDCLPIGSTTTFQTYDGFGWIATAATTESSHLWVAYPHRSKHLNTICWPHITHNSY